MSILDLGIGDHVLKRTSEWWAHLHQYPEWSGFEARTAETIEIWVGLNKTRSRILCTILK